MADPTRARTFKQGMNNYAAATLGVFSNTGNMYTVVLGGISFGFFANGVFQTDAEFPFINQVTTIRSTPGPVHAISDGRRIPGDPVDAIEPGQSTAFTARIVSAVACASAPPKYVRLEAAPSGERSGGYGPYFGIVPDFGESEQPGTKIGGVRPGSPAEKAGVRAGDIIVQFAGVTVKTIEDLTFALRGQRPGQRVEVVIVRDKQGHRMEAVLEDRR